MARNPKITPAPVVEAKVETSELSVRSPEPTETKTEKVLFTGWGAREKDGTISPFNSDEEAKKRADDNGTASFKIKIIEV